ncbi:ATP-dependent DNA helicase RecG [Anaplasma bovis]|uniref:ATP-dependent DNA helicase RecG n=1 Tax=Anaplasma bovis TaxID=186733 RepID=UPI002FF24E55
MVAKQQKAIGMLTSIYDIPGVDNQKGALLEKLCRGARVVDLLLYAPYSYVDRRNTDLERIPVGEVVTFSAVVKKHLPPFMGKRGKKTGLPYKVLLGSEIGEVWLAFFHYSNSYLENVLKIGKVCVVSGKLERRRDDSLQITHPDYITSNVNRFPEICVLEPVYSVTKGVHSRMVHRVIKTALRLIEGPNEWINPQLMKENSWYNWKESVSRVHNPQSLDEVSVCRQRLAYDELLAYHAATYLAYKRQGECAGVSINVKGVYHKQVLTKLQFKLTSGQKSAIQRITKSQMSDRQMTALLQGDVGSGKTVVALFSMLSAVEGEGQVAFMVPTEILAEQHCTWIREMLSSMDIRVEMLTGNSKNKSAIKESLINGDAHIVIGTHALFQESVKFRNLRLVVIDEQQRFGVLQRMKLIEKGISADILFITATPIPRTLEQILYGNMDRITLPDKPKCRLPIRTSMVNVSKMDEVCARLHSMIERGNKAYWICPHIEESKMHDVSSVESRFQYLKETFGDTVGMVHGGLAQSHNDNVMMKFYSGELKVLAATSIIEVGVNVPDATIIVIENPERFGLSQLHQLRGRVGRSNKKSFCILLHGDVNTTSWHKLSVLCNSQDGFFIAEQDLILRGGGDVLGNKQSGIASFRFADPLDFSGMSSAYSDIRSMVKTDKGVQLVHELVEIYGRQLSNINY